MSRRVIGFVMICVIAATAVLAVAVVLPRVRARQAYRHNIQEWQARWLRSKQGLVRGVDLSKDGQTVTMELSDKWYKLPTTEQVTVVKTIRREASVIRQRHNLDKHDFTVDLGLFGYSNPRETAIEQADESIKRWRTKD